MTIISNITKLRNAVGNHRIDAFSLRVSREGCELAAEWSSGNMVPHSVAHRSRSLARLLALMLDTLRRGGVVR